MKPVRKKIIAQIDDVVADVERTMNDSESEDLSDLPDSVPSLLVTRLAAAIDRLSPPRSQYRMNAEKAIKNSGSSSVWTIDPLLGILRALKADYVAGYLERVEELVEANLFSDFLQQAEHLLKKRYKDAAAVLIGGVLEEVLRKAAARHGVKAEASGKPKQAAAINVELADAGVYNKLDEKAVIAWLDLRNKAAHGEFAQYTEDQVRLFLEGVREFALRLAA